MINTFLKSFGLIVKASEMMITINISSGIYSAVKKSQVLKLLEVRQNFAT